jgi:hypothetical protein
VSIGVDPDADWRAKLLIDQVMEGGNLGRLFTIECAEADKSSHVPPSGETPTRLKLVGCVAAAGENGQPTRRRFPVAASPTRQTLQSEATGAVMEATKWLKPLVSVSRIGDSASVQAVTRVIAEQASLTYFHRRPS